MLAMEGRTGLICVKASDRCGRECRCRRLRALRPTICGPITHPHLVRWGERDGSRSSGALRPLFRGLVRRPAK